MATTRTPSELAKNVLLAPNIIAAEETPSAADSQYVIQRYTDLFEEMMVNDEFYWPLNEIPAAVFEPLTEMMVLIISPAFGEPVDAASMDEGLRILRRRLRRTVNIKSDELATQFEDF
jgi:hypothetical protein